MAKGSCTERRVRIIHRFLLKDPDGLCSGDYAQKRDGIEKVRTVPDIASIVIILIQKKLPKAKLFILLDAVMGIWQKKPNATSQNCTC